MPGCARLKCIWIIISSDLRSSPPTKYQNYKNGLNPACPLDSVHRMGASVFEVHQLLKRDRLCHKPWWWIDVAKKKKSHACSCFSRFLLLVMAITWYINMLIQHSLTVFYFKLNLFWVVGMGTTGMGTGLVMGTRNFICIHSHSTLTCVPYPYSWPSLSLIYVVGTCKGYQRCKMLNSIPSSQSQAPKI